MAEIRCGDALTELRMIPDASVRCCVTSPPYWGLRDYGTGTWEGGEASCQHKGKPKPRQDTNGASGEEHGRFKATRGLQPGKSAYSIPVREVCKCGARRIDQQLGLERTPEEYIAKIVEVFREVRGAMTADGTLWLNLGDCYATGAGKVGEHPGGGIQGDRWAGAKSRGTRDGTHAGKHTAMAALGPMNQPNRMPLPGLKPKDLVGIPWRVALALQADGWYLRADIIWHKTNPMPESVRDRPTKAHEYLFLFSKSERYFFDADAISEPAGYAHEARLDPGTNGLGGGDRKTGITTRRFRSGNKARKPGSARGCPEGTGSNVCGSVPWEGVTRNIRSVWTIPTKPYRGAHFATFPEELPRRCILAGTAPGDIVLDPFAGSGTVGKVATHLGRDALLLELNPKFIPLIVDRVGAKHCTVRGAA
jgi:DNA modification methylase